MLMRYDITTHHILCIRYKTITIASQALSKTTHKRRNILIKILKRADVPFWIVYSPRAMDHLRLVKFFIAFQGFARQD